MQKVGGPTSRLGHWGCSSGCHHLAETGEAFRDPWRAFQQQQWDIQKDWRDGGAGHGDHHQAAQRWRNSQRWSLEEEVPAVCVAVTVDVALAGAARSRTLEDVFMHGQN